ncbi:MAG TPA: NADH-quinone oxidoreductase subunit C [Verrucomicrobiales bacterium]|nr:NADH-quinone oxidoreductase subunit C [Verrucomicrobiales bacterium]
MSSKEAAEKLQTRFEGIVSELTEFRDEWTLQVADPNRIADVCHFAKQSLGFDYLVDITGIDNYGEDPRFTVVYELYGLDHHCHLRLKTDVTEESSSLPSISGVWRTADWHEREIYDMMGIHFEGHPNLKRILMWEGYEYFPLRKDFPMEGKPSEVTEVASTSTAPMEGGPFVTSPGGGNSGTAHAIRFPCGPPYTN